ncbi:class I SAM-dependent methyltransferase [Sabulicella glaciei]|uniref:Class I SAM-dependent methyltransferase n=1 Tax=Sabulicella glaciei TaxID=2984948 RepID=A0ABT3NUT8_9PROT|nr:class I SAM-dependent methyltransferase [Roseococcus sp. MDT2-1-1]MCW8085918.1 class I SAM-dependent methyltransferase [Roseococcus sp. MDT2-1-1]
MSTSLAWDERYGAGEWLFGDRPNDYLRAQSWRFPARGEALALGDGEGRNGTFLAGCGLDTLSVDWSPVAVARAAELARARGVPLRTAVADLARWDWPEARFDVIAWIFLHLPPEDRAAVAAGTVRALRPGGLLVLEGFSPAQSGRRSGGPREPALLWTRAAAEDAFGALTLLECTEGTVKLDEGPKHQGEAEVLRGVWRVA